MPCAQTICQSFPSQASDLETLLRFLAFPINRTAEIFALFSGIDGAEILGNGRRRVLYVESSRPIAEGRVLLVAHADTVWDDHWHSESENDGDVGDEAHGSSNPGQTPEFADLVESNGIIRSANPFLGIGADDRAGLAILWLMRKSGHSLMVTDLEECGRLGSEELRSAFGSRLTEINRAHGFAVQFDRRGGRDFKCYDVGSEEFRNYVATVTGYTEPDCYSFTDICTLCAPRSGPAMCGVNLSVGYRYEHTPQEQLTVREWAHTLNLVRDWLAQPSLPSFCHGVCPGSS